MANCLIVNACWFAACLPIFTIGASTAAMYATIQRNILHDKGYPFPTFWKEFKRELQVGDDHLAGGSGGQRHSDL